jgi:hypothetical protein
VDEAIMAIATDSENNAYVTGRAMIEGQGTQIITMKLRAGDGEILWTKYIGGAAGLDDIAWDVAVGPDDNPVITGYIVEEGEVAHYITRKLLNLDGRTLWDRVEPGALYNIEVRSGWLNIVDGGDVVVAHRTFGANGYDVVLKRYAAGDGATVWDVVYDGPTHGGDDVRAACLDSQGNLLVAGVQDVQWNYNFMALKFDTADGSLIWEAGYDGPPGWYDVANCVAEGPTGSVVVSGLSDGSGTGWDWATVAFDGADGSQLWVQRYDGPASQSDEAQAILATDNGDVYVTGYGYGEGTAKDLVTIRYQVQTSSPAVDLPLRTITARAWPNPFNPRVSIAFELPRAGHTAVAVFDTRGRRVATLVEEELGTGSHTTVWDGRHTDGRAAAAGTYLVRVQSGNLQSVQKVVLAK